MRQLFSSIPGQVLDFMVVLIGLGVYAALFAVFFFDLDGKALFYGVEPFLCRHYDRMERRDPLKQKYDMNKPTYEYNK